MSSFTIKSLLCDLPEKETIVGERAKSRCSIKSSEGRGGGALKRVVRQCGRVEPVRGHMEAHGWDAARIGSAARAGARIRSRERSCGAPRLSPKGLRSTQPRIQAPDELQMSIGEAQLA